MFYPSDWRGDERLSICSISSRGLWIEMLCIMHHSEPYGELRINGLPLSIKQLGSITRLEQTDLNMLLDELKSAGVFSESDGVIFSRRMKRDEDRSNVKSQNGSRGGNPVLKQQDNRQVKQPLKQEDKPHIPYSISIDNYNSRDLKKEKKYKRAPQHGDQNPDSVFLKPEFEDDWKPHAEDFEHVKGKPPEIDVDGGFWFWKLGEAKRVRRKNAYRR